MAKHYKRFFVIVADSAGVGEEPDAAKFGDVGSNTWAHAAESVGGLKVPFKRPAELATDTCGSNEVIQHAYRFYEKQGKHYDAILLLQPTSPFRKVEFLKEAIALYDDSIDMVTSVKLSSCNPYYDGFEDNEEGLLTICKGDGKIERRQDAPKVWQQNGSIYIINPRSLMEKGMANFTRIRKYPMDELYSVDLDNMLDWKIAELIINEHLL